MCIVRRTRRIVTSSLKIQQLSILKDPPKSNKEVSLKKLNETRGSKNGKGRPMQSTYRKNEERGRNSRKLDVKTWQETRATLLPVRFPRTFGFQFFSVSITWLAENLDQTIYTDYHIRKKPREHGLHAFNGLFDARALNRVYERNRSWTETPVKKIFRKYNHQVHLTQSGQAGSTFTLSSARRKYTISSI